MRIALPLLVLAALIPATAGAEAVTLAYEIRKDATPIGSETVRIDRQGAATVVEVETHTRAQVLFLEFKYDHRRQEIWQGDKLMRMVAETSDDGTHTRTEATAGDDGWTFVVNGQTSRRGGDSLPLTLWGRAILNRSDLFSIIDAKQYKVTVASLGTEQISVGGRSLAAEHIRIGGDVERDLWYGPDGLLLRATFQRSGFPIEIQRTDSLP